MKGNGTHTDVADCSDAQTSCQAGNPTAETSGKISITLIKRVGGGILIASVRRRHGRMDNNRNDQCVNTKDAGHYYRKH